MIDVEGSLLLEWDSLKTTTKPSVITSRLFSSMENVHGSIDSLVVLPLLFSYFSQEDGELQPQQLKNAGRTCF